MHLEPGIGGQASYDIARVYAREGRVEESVRWLRKAVDAGFSDWNRIRANVDLDVI